MGSRMLVALGIILSLGCGGAGARVIYVNGNVSPPTANGLTWATALKTITLGLAAAQPGDEVWVAAGNYAGPVTLKAGVGLYGGFAGFETQRSQRLGIASLTAIEGSGHSPVVSTPRDTIIEGDTVLDGFTIRNGVAVLPGGAGVVILAGAPTITHNVIVNNTAVLTKMVGGGIYCATGTRPLIAGNVIAANSADSGGGIYVAGARPTVVNNTIVGNGGVVGGGICFAGTVGGIYANNIIAFNLTGVSSLKGDTAAFHHNCVYGNELGDFPAQTTDPDPEHSVRADPLLASYEWGNMHIQPGSPCRDAGDDAAAALAPGDVDLQARPLGAHADIGADESDGREWMAQPSIVYVRPDADDANDGSSWARAKRTMSAGLTTASRLPGAEVWAAAGTYVAGYVPGQPYVEGPFVVPAFVYLYGGFSGTETDRSQRDWTANPTVITGGKTTALACRAGQHQSAVDGFIVANTVNTGLPDGTITGINCLGGSPAIENNALVGNTGAVSLYDSAAVLRNNALVGNAPISQTFAPVACTSSVPTITNNLFADNGPVGGKTASGAISLAQCPAATISDNLFRSNGTSLSGQTASVLLATGSKALVTGNTMVFNSGTNMVITLGSKVTLANNIFAFTSTPVAGSVTANTVNCVANCLYGLPDSRTLPEPFRAARGNFSAYPQFADYMNDDYRLGPTSPCVDTGSDDYTRPAEVDLDGLPRVQGRGVDIGAYESSFTGAARNWPDVARILRMAGGLSAAADPALLEGDQQAGLTVGDAIVLARWLLLNPVK